MADCWIYFDEVGNFHKSSLGRSLIGGWFSFTPPTDEQCLSILRAALGLESATSVLYHAVDHKVEVERHLRRALPQVAQLRWQPVVFSVQQESFLDHPIPTYMHAMADGLFTLARHLMRTRGEGVTLHVTAASWSSADERQYERIRERLQLERLRRTWTRGDLPVDVIVTLDDARYHHGLMVADMLMYGLTHLDRYPDDLRDRMLDMLGPFLFNVLASEDEQRVDEHLMRRDYGQALIETYALRAAGQPHPDIEEHVLAELGRLGEQPYALDAAFEALGNRIEFEVAERRLEGAERQLSGWLDMLERLEVVQEVDVDAVARARVRALELQLRCCNHKGAVEDAERVLQKLRPASAALAGQLEALPVVLDVRSLDGVHRTNCYDFAVWEELADLADGMVDLHEAMQRLAGGTDGVRSALRGRLLGTALQACTKAARHDPTRFDAARELSQSALEEFTRTVDLRRQHGYRCELETDAGNLEAASRWLRVAAGYEPDLPLPDVVARIASEDRLGFNLMHAVRLWAAYEWHSGSDASLRPAADLLMGCFTANICARTEIESSESHPWPVVAWMVGRAVGLRPRGNPTIACRYIRSALRRLEANPRHLTLLSIALAARCDLLALHLLHPGLESLTDDDWDEAVSLARRLAGSSVKTLAAWFEAWPDRLAAVVRKAAEGASDEAAEVLRAMAREVPY